MDESVRERVPVSRQERVEAEEARHRPDRVCEADDRIEPSPEREDAENPEEEDLEEKPEPEGGEGNPEDGKEPSRVVDQGGLAPRAHPSDRNAESQGDEDRSRHELERRGQVFDDAPRHGLVGADRCSKIAPEEVAHIEAVLNPDGPVEAHPDTHDFNLLRPRPRAEEGGGGVGGNDPGKEESDHR
jgi:hypothetical protein